MMQHKFIAFLLLLYSNALRLENYVKLWIVRCNKQISSYYQFAEHCPRESILHSTIPSNIDLDYIAHGNVTSIKYVSVPYLYQ